MSLHQPFICADLTSITLEEVKIVSLGWGIEASLPSLASQPSFMLPTQELSKQHKRPREGAGVNSWSDRKEMEKTRTLHYRSGIPVTLKAGMGRS